MHSADDPSFRRLAIAALLMLWSGCSLQPLQQQSGDNLGRRQSHRSPDQSIASGFPDELTGPAFSPPLRDIAVLRYGKVEVIPSHAHVAGIVVGAPHGTFDVHTAQVVRRICLGAGLAGVVASGFTPRETGDGWRINVNRPSERHVVLNLGEARTSRARVAFEQFKQSTLAAAGGKLDLYVEIHQNTGARIEVASVGISRHEARLIKNTFVSVRDQTLGGRRDIAVVDLAIEPLDELEVGAWPAKADGILKLARKSLHFELPADGVMASEEHRRVYTLILTQLLSKITRPISTNHASVNLTER